MSFSEAKGASLPGRGGLGAARCDAVAAGSLGKMRTRDQPTTAPEPDNDTRAKTEASRILVRQAIYLLSTQLKVVEAALKLALLTCVKRKEESEGWAMKRILRLSLTIGGMLLVGCGGGNDNTTTQPKPDTTPPAPVTDLRNSVATPSSDTLRWTAPGNDGSVGTASSYDIRYSTTPVVDSTWANATHASGVPAPQAAGSQESLVVAGLQSGTTYYFALKTADAVPNWSELSNPAHATTSSPGPPTGSCCAPAGTCTVTTQSACTGTWMGANTTCAPNPCVATGACCAPAGTCTVTTQANCTSASTWQGAGTTCTPNPCPQPTGACCNAATGACTITTQTECDFNWLGAEVACDVTTCPEPPLLPDIVSDTTGWTLISSIDQSPYALCYYTYVKNQGGPGEIAVIVVAGSYTDTTRFTVQSNIRYVLVTKIPGRMESTAYDNAGIMSVTFPGTPPIRDSRKMGGCAPFNPFACSRLIVTERPKLALVPSGTCCTAGGGCTAMPQANCDGTWTQFGSGVPQPCAQPADACSNPTPGRAQQRRRRASVTRPAYQPPWRPGVSRFNRTGTVSAIMPS